MRVHILLRFALVLAIGFTAFMALNPNPPHLPLDRLGDKFTHMGAFAVLGGIARFAFPKAGNWIILERLSFFGALIEVFQAIPALRRTCDWSDWLADTTSLALSLAILHLVRQSWTKRKAAPAHR